MASAAQDGMSSLQAGRPRWGSGQLDSSKGCPAAPHSTHRSCRCCTCPRQRGPRLHQQVATEHEWRFGSNGQREDTGHKLSRASSSRHSLCAQQPDGVTATTYVTAMPTEPHSLEGSTSPQLAMMWLAWGQLEQPCVATAHTERGGSTTGLAWPQPAGAAAAPSAEQQRGQSQASVARSNLHGAAGSTRVR